MTNALWLVLAFAYWLLIAPPLSIAMWLGAFWLRKLTDKIKFKRKKKEKEN